MLTIRRFIIYFEVIVGHCFTPSQMSNEWKLFKCEQKMTNMTLYSSDSLSRIVQLENRPP